MTMKAERPVLFHGVVVTINAKRDQNRDQTTTTALSKNLTFFPEV
jgi:hypothetical protein